MKAEFSEFSYGFAVAHGLLKDMPGISAVPHFPSLVEEGRLGYDVGLDYLGLPIFVQFKLSDYLTDLRAKYWGYYQSPYFRFNVIPLIRSRQHNLLKELADSGKMVFYVAPLFSTVARFDEAFRQNLVARRSIWLPLEKLPGLTDDDSHHITFTGPSGPSWHTEEWNLEGKLLEGEFSWQRVYEDITDRFERKELHQMSGDYLYELRETLYGILNRSVPEDSQELSRQPDVNDVLRDIGYMLTTYFGLEMVVLRSATPSS